MLGTTNQRLCCKVKICHGCVKRGNCYPLQKLQKLSFCINNHSLLVKKLEREVKVTNLCFTSQMAGL